MLSRNQDLCVIGAGPYGLSLAAFLNHAGIRFRIFGTPFNSWRTQMPHNMILKSAGFSSNIAHPLKRLTLREFSAERGIPYADDLEPVHLKDFCDYGLEFQRRFVPQLEPTAVRLVTADGNGFRIELASGEEVFSSRVVVATGTSFFDHIPPVLGKLPCELMTHSSAHRTFDRFRGKKVVVIGRGASGVNAAAFARQIGVDAHLYTRKAVEFDMLDPNSTRPSWFKSLLKPKTALGPGWPTAFLAWTPWAFHHLPEDLRIHVVQRKLGPAAGRFLYPLVEGVLPVHSGAHLQSAVEEKGRVRMVFRYHNGDVEESIADHVIAGTGFRVDVARMPILDPALARSIRTAQGSPILSSSFESSIPGLFFTGLAATVSFGPLLRFVAGTDFCSSTLARHLQRFPGHQSSWRSRFATQPKPVT